MRVGKNVEHFKAAASAADARNLDPILRYCAVGRQLGYAIYLSLDLMTYVSLIFVLSISIEWLVDQRDLFRFNYLAER